MRRAHSEREWPPRSFVVPVRTRIAQGQREESTRRVEALARRAECGQASAPPLRLSANEQIVKPATLSSASQYHPRTPYT